MYKDTVKLQESIQKALRGKLNEGFWDNENFEYDLENHPEYSESAIKAKQLLRQLLQDRGFKTSYFREDHYRFDEPWLDVEKNGIEDSFDVLEINGELYVMSGNEAEDGDDSTLTAIGYNHPEEMKLYYDAEHNFDNINRIGVKMSVDNYKSEMKDFVNKLDSDFNKASELKGDTEVSNMIDSMYSDEDIEKAIKTVMDRDNGYFTNDSAYDVAEEITGKSDIDDISDLLVDKIREIFRAKFN